MTLITTGLNTLKAPFADVAADSLNLAWQTGTLAGDTFTCTGREILLIRNDSGTNTVTITSVDNEKGRAENLASNETSPPSRQPEMKSLYPSPDVVWVTSIESRERFGGVSFVISAMDVNASEVAPSPSCKSEPAAQKAEDAIVVS